MGRRLVMVLGGAGLYVLALPPFDIGPLAWVALTPLLLVLRGTSAPAGFAWGLLYGCAFGWGATWWSVQAVARYFAFGLPVTVLGLSAFYAAIFAPSFGLFGAGATLLLRRPPWLATFAVSALWAASELIRGRLVGQPWGLLGYSQHAETALIQMTTVTGVYGLSFLLALVATALADLMARARTRDARAAVGRLGVALAVVGVVWIPGRFHVPPAPADAAGPRVALVQTGIAPAFEWTRAYAGRQLRAHIQMTEAIETHPSLVLWPENAVTEYLETERGIAAWLGSVATRLDADLVFGAPRHEAGHTYNSVRMIRASGRYGGHYDKQQLVPMAEASLLTAPTPAAPSASPRSFSAGTDPGILWSIVPLGPTICHEILYPELVGRTVRAGAGVLINLSNDGWLDAGHGVASRQHFAMATIRAVETRRFLLRAATSGISGAIDPWGRVVGSLGPGVVGVLTVPVTARTDLTPYVRLGDAFAFGCGLLALVVALPHPIRRRRDRSLWTPARDPLPSR